MHPFVWLPLLLQEWHHGVKNQSHPLWELGWDQDCRPNLAKYPEIIFYHKTSAHLKFCRCFKLHIFFVFIGHRNHLHPINLHPKHQLKTLAVSFYHRQEIFSFILSIKSIYIFLITFKMQKYVHWIIILWCFVINYSGYQNPCCYSVCWQFPLVL